VGDRLTCIFVDNGLLRVARVGPGRERFSRRFKMNLVVSTRRALPHEIGRREDPEQKRRSLAESSSLCSRRGAQGRQGDFLVQGTLYPDVIESVSHKGPSATIKSHHNVGGLAREDDLLW